jgi:hypothetical protein
MKHAWRILASDSEGVIKAECRRCGLQKLVTPCEPIPKVLWIPKGRASYYGPTPGCSTNAKEAK